MPSVHGVDCDFVEGRGASLKDRVELWQAAGHNGYGAQLKGQGDAEFRYHLIKFDSNANVLTWIAAIEALQGASGSIVDGIGNTHTNQLISVITQPAQRKVVRGDVEEYKASIDIQGVKTG